MKILIIILSNEMSLDNLTNIKILNDYVEKLRENNNIVDYCGISKL